MQQWAQILQKFQHFFNFINKMPKRFRGKCIVQMRNERVKQLPKYFKFKMPKFQSSVMVLRQQEQNKDICYTARYQWSVSCLADPYVPCCPGLRDPQALRAVGLVTYGSGRSICPTNGFGLLPVQESFLWTKGASVIISSMSALQLHLLLIHNLLIPQVRLRHAQKCMLHSSIYTHARARQWHYGHRDWWAHILMVENT